MENKAERNTQQSVFRYNYIHVIVKTILGSPDRSTGVKSVLYSLYFPGPASTSTSSESRNILQRFFLGPGIICFCVALSDGEIIGRRADLKRRNPCSESTGTGRKTLIKVHIFQRYRVLPSTTYLDPWKLLYHIDYRVQNSPLSSEAFDSVAWKRFLFRAMCLTCPTRSAEVPTSLSFPVLSKYRLLVSRLSSWSTSQTIY